MCRRYPLLRLAQGQVLIEAAQRSDRLYVLREGLFEVLLHGICVVRVSEPGAFLGEMSAVLGAAPSATVVATRDSVVHVIDNAAATVREQPDLTLAIAQLMARRLVAVTAYLVDIKRQYAGDDGHLSVMDRVLGDLVSAVSPDAMALGSEREDLPDY